LPRHGRAKAGKPTFVRQEEKAADAVESTGRKLGNQQPRRIDRPGQGDQTLGNSLEAGLAVVRLVAHQHHQAMSPALRFRQRPLDQLLADAADAERRLHRERAKQQGRRGPDHDRRQPHRPDQQRADTRGERKFGDVIDLLADAIGRLGKSPRPKGARIQAVDGRGVLRRLRQNSDGKVVHRSRSLLAA